MVTDNQDVGTADWELLPQELLRGVLAALLPPSDRPLPLLAAAQQWLALRCTCHAWAAALEGHPVSVEACVPVPWMLPWVHAHVATLRLLPPPPSLSAPSTARDVAFDWVQSRCGPMSAGWDQWAVDLEAPQAAACIAYEEYIGKLSTGTTEHSGEPCRAFRFQSSLWVAPGTPWQYDGAYSAQPMLQLAAMGRLQELDITCGYQGGGSWGTHTFDTAPLSGLPRLHTLVLRGFEEPCLAGLPPALRLLRLLGGRHNDTRHNPVRYPRHHFALPAYSRLDQVEILGYNKDYRGAEAGADMAQLSAGNVVQLFASKRRSKVLLTNLCRQCRRVRTDAEVLHCGPPDPVLTTKRWLPPDHGLAVHLSDELDPVLEALASAMGASPRLRQLQLSPAAWFVLPSGALVPAAALQSPAGCQLLQDRWPGVGLVQAEEEGGTDWLTLTWQPA